MAKAMDIFVPEKEPDEKNHKPKTTKPGKKASLLFILILAIGAVAAFMISKEQGQPIPKKVQQATSFSIYYPSSLPGGYVLDKKTITSENQILFYSLSNGNKKISVSEQAAPKNPPDFSQIQKGNTSFKKLEVKGGQAIYGVSQNLPASIFLSNTTLVNLSGTQNVPLDILVKLTQNLGPI